MHTSLYLNSTWRHWSSYSTVFSTGYCIHKRTVNVIYSQINSFSLLFVKSPDFLSLEKKISIFFTLSGWQVWRYVRLTPIPTKLWCWTPWAWNGHVEQAKSYAASKSSAYLRGTRLKKKKYQTVILAYLRYVSKSDVKLCLWCYSECISTPDKLENMPGHGGNRTYDLWSTKKIMITRLHWCQRN
jgi:hypothetical protein